MFVIFERLYTNIHKPVECVADRCSKNSALLSGIWNSAEHLKYRFVMKMIITMMMMTRQQQQPQNNAAEISDRLVARQLCALEMKQNELKMALQCVDVHERPVPHVIPACHRFCMPISSADGQLIGLSQFYFIFCQLPQLLSMYSWYLWILFYICAERSSPNWSRRIYETHTKRIAAYIYNTYPNISKMIHCL